MNIYKYIQLEDGDILLKKIKINFDKYNIVENENGNKLLKKYIKVKNIEHLNNYNFTYSNIIKCFINETEFFKLKYKPILNKIYEIINDGTKIIKNTTLNIKTTEKTDEGFYHLNNLGISIQGVDANKCIFEIINQCIKNKITILLEIKLTNKTTLKLIF